MVDVIKCQPTKFIRRNPFASRDINIRGLVALQNVEHILVYSDEITTIISSSYHDKSPSGLRILTLSAFATMMPRHHQQYF